MKMYVVVRSDLAPGAQVAQSCHALRLFAAEHPHIDRYWYAKSNNLVVLQVPDEASLLALSERAREAKVAASTFREPDYGNEATAVAVEPDGWKLVSSLRLALRAA